MLPINIGVYYGIGKKPKKSTFDIPVVIETFAPDEKKLLRMKFLNPQKTGTTFSLNLKDQIQSFYYLLNYNYLTSVVELLVQRFILLHFFYAMLLLTEIYLHG